MVKSGLKISNGMKNVLYVVGGLLVILLLISLLSSNKNASPASAFGHNDIASNKYAAFEGFSNSSEGPKVMLFHATWCGHCEKYLASGIFDKASETAGIPFEKYDADKNEELREKYDITSFPTIIGVNKKGDKSEFTGDRDNTKSLLEFAKSLM